MPVIHPIYGRGTVIGASKGLMARVKFDRKFSGLLARSASNNVLAVSLRVCARG